jgi:hypothetical protein
LFEIPYDPVGDRRVCGALNLDYGPLVGGDISLAQIDLKFTRKRLAGKTLSEF